MSDFETPILTMDLSWAEEGDQRVIRGCASIPQVDRERELVLSSAIEGALDNFMALPVLHLDHTERPIGLVTSASMDDGALMIQGTIKNTDDCDDVWSRIKSGELSQYSIYGRRIEGSKTCKIHPDHRDEPCKTLKLHLDSISVCPSGNAINPATFVEIVKGIVVKSTNSVSARTDSADGEKEKKEMVDTAAAPPSDSAPEDVLQQVLDAVTGMNDRLMALEQTVEEMTSVEPEDIEKAEEEEGYDGAEYDEGPDIQDQLSTLAEGVTMALQEISELKEQISGGDVQKAELEEEEEYPGDGYEDEDSEEYPDDGYEEEGDGPEDEVEKGGCIKKSYPGLPDEVYNSLKSIPSLLSAIEEQQKDISILRKAVLELEQTSPRDRKVRVVEMGDSQQIVKKSKTPEPLSGDVTDSAAMLIAGQFMR